MTETSRYATARLGALWDRVATLEHAIEAAGAFLERGLDRGTAEIDARPALAVLHAALQETFTSAILCSRDMTDDQLDQWLQEAGNAQRV